MGLFSFIKEKILKKPASTKDKYVAGLDKSRKNFSSKLNLLSKKYRQATDEYFEELEEILIMADIGVSTVMDFIDRLKRRVKKENNIIVGFF